MGPTTVATRGIPRWVVVLAGVLMAAAMLFLSSPSGAFASASAPDTPGGDQEQTEFYFGGVITFDGEPVADVVISVDGGGFEAETITDAEGKWRLYVPEKDEYTLVVDEDTLPDGVIVDPAQLPEGMQPNSGTTASFDVEFGATGTKIVNLFLGEGERLTTSFWDQFSERLISGVNFGLLLALAAVGVSLIFGTTGLTNFAHAEMLTFGAIIALVFANMGLPMWLVIPIVIVFGAAFGWALDAGLWRPLRRKGSDSSSS
nr:hypothetical protein GCM10025699_02670 [Microbacterium flavescens]